MGYVKISAITTATVPEDADTLADRRTRVEIEKMIAEVLKLGAEQAKFNAEQTKLYAEAVKMTRERAWYPADAISAAVAAGAALATLLAKFIG